MYEESDKEKFSRLSGKRDPFNLEPSDGADLRGEIHKIDLSYILKDDLGITKSEPTTTIGRKTVLLTLENQPGFDRLDVFQVWGAKLAIASLQMAVSFGYLNPDGIKRIADFGAGYGGPTFALVAVARGLGATVNAVERNDRSADHITETGILHAQDVIKADGIAYLESLSERGVEHYDLVTAYMLGPDREGVLFRKLAKACSKGLALGGNLLVTSDGRTIETAREVCQTAGVHFNRIPGISDGEKALVPTTIVIPQASCETIGLSSPRYSSKNPFTIDFTEKGKLFDKKFSVFDLKDKYLR